MRLRIGLYSLVISACLSLTVKAADAPYSDELPSSHWAFGFNGGGHIGSKEMQENAAYYGTLEYVPFDYFSLSFQGGEMFSTPKDTSFLPMSNANILSFELVPRLRLPVPRMWIDLFETTLTPYLSAGVGYYLIGGQRTLNNFIDDPNPPFTIVATQETQKVNAQLGGVFGGGVDMRITETYSLEIDMSYIYLRPRYQDVTTSNPGGTVTNVDTRLNLDTLRITAGFKIRI